MHLLGEKKTLPRVDRSSFGMELPLKIGTSTEDRNWTYAKDTLNNEHIPRTACTITSRGRINPTAAVSTRTKFCPCDQVRHGFPKSYTPVHLLQTPMHCNFQRWTPNRMQGRRSQSGRGNPRSRKREDQQRACTQRNLSFFFFFQKKGTLSSLEHELSTSRFSIADVRLIKALISQSPLKATA